MRLTRVHVKGFRCIKDLKVDFDALTALIGSGGVGKSAMLRAIDWCINERPSDAEDLFRGSEDADEIFVAVTFGALNQADREALGRYGTGETTTFTRTWRDGEAPKLSGSALVLPAFDKVRAASSAADRKKAYREIFESGEFALPDPMPTKVADVERDMARFEMENAQLCELRAEDASHLFGFAGGSALRQRFDYVLVDATVDASGSFGAGRDSALSRLLATIGELDEATKDEIAELQQKAADEIASRIGSARRESLDGIADGITRRVRDYVPAASIELREELLPLRPPEARPIVRVRESEGHATDVERQGHGLQRALVIALLQEVAETVRQTDQADDAAGDRGTLMLAIEEPELYQHPLQARALAQALSVLAADADEGGRRTVQIAYSTHSAHFVQRTLFESLRLFRRGEDASTRSTAADPSAVSQALVDAGMDGELGDQVRNTLAVTLQEAVFARAVLLCEGKTDAALMEALAERDRGFERDGIAVAVCWGKTILPIALAILKQLDIPTFVLFDADAGLDARLARKTSVTEDSRKAQIADVGRKNARLMVLCGEAEDEWPERAVRASCANFGDNLEADIKELWPELHTDRITVARDLGMKPKSEEAYRQAAARCGPPPDFFTSLLTAVRSLVP